MAVGVLGATGLQLRGLDASRDALMRSEATQLASDIANRIQVNPGIDYSVTPTTAPAAANDCTVDNCTPAQMSAYDIAQWKCAINSLDTTGASPVTYPACSAASGLDINGSLPRGQGGITRDVKTILVDDDEYTITVSWQAPKSNTTSSVSLIIGTI